VGCNGLKRVVLVAVPPRARFVLGSDEQLKTLILLPCGPACWKPVEFIRDGDSTGVPTPLPMVVLRSCSKGTVKINNISSWP